MVSNINTFGKEFFDILRRATDIIIPVFYFHSGLGTDHAWGGNHFILGGSVRGGRIHGQYPGM